MSQTEATTAVVAEERMEEIRSFARKVRTATQRSYTTKETIQVALERCRREVSLKNYARDLVSKPHFYNAWIREFMEAGKDQNSSSPSED